MAGLRPVAGFLFAGFHKFHHTKASFVTAIAHNATAAVTQKGEFCLRN